MAGNARQRLELDSEKIVETVAALGRRIEERFPESGLSEVCAALWRITQQARRRSEQFQRPIVSLRLGVGV